MCQRLISAREADSASVAPVTEAFSHFNVGFCAIRVDITAQHAEGTYWDSLDPWQKGKNSTGLHRRRKLQTAAWRCDAFLAYSYLDTPSPSRHWSYSYGLIIHIYLLI
jgi:hypothetical protein